MHIMYMGVPWNRVTPPAAVLPRVTLGEHVCGCGPLVEYMLLNANVIPGGAAHSCCYLLSVRSDGCKPCLAAQVSARSREDGTGFKLC